MQIEAERKKALINMQFFVLSLKLAGKGLFSLDPPVRMQPLSVYP